MERLTSEQIRLLEELRELRDAGILTVDEFDFQVAKVLGRPQGVESIPVVEEPSAPQEPDETAVAENRDEAQEVEQSDFVEVVPTAATSHETELLEYELVEPGFSDEDEIPVEENQVAEPPSTSDNPTATVVESDPQQHNSSRRKVLVGTTVSLVLISVIALVALVGGGKSDPTSTQFADNTTTVTQSTMATNTDTPTTSTQFADNTTTVTQNASTGTVNQPTSPLTTVATSSMPSTPSTILNAVSPTPGPTVSFEVPEQERNPPTVSQLTMTPERVSAGDTVRISVRVVDATGVSGVTGRISTLTYPLGSYVGDCGGGEFTDLSLSSGNEKDGLWSFDCYVGSPPGQWFIVIRALDIYSAESTPVFSFEVL